MYCNLLLPNDQCKFFYGAIQLAIIELKNVKLIAYFTNQI